MGKPRVERCGRVTASELLDAARAAGVDPRADGGLSLRIGINGNAEERVFVPVVETRQPTGGIRLWLKCPRCFRRRSVLHTDPRLSFDFLSCRTCLGLCYHSQMVSTKDRWRLQAEKLLAKAGHGRLVPEAEQRKPTRMRWRTYNDLVERSNWYEDASLRLSLSSSSFGVAIMGLGRREGRDLAFNKARWARRKGAGAAYLDTL